LNKSFSPEYLNATGVGVDERIIFKCILAHSVCLGVDWILLSQDKMQWSAVVKKAMKILNITVQGEIRNKLSN
jgi:hypothetical protein